MLNIKMIENFSKEEEITNAILHGIGFGIAAAALVLLIVFANISGTVWHIVGFSIYGSMLCLMYLSSIMAYNGSVCELVSLFHDAVFSRRIGNDYPIGKYSMSKVRVRYRTIEFGVTDTLMPSSVSFPPCRITISQPKFHTQSIWPYQETQEYRQSTILQLKPIVSLMKHTTPESKGMSLMVRL